MTTGLAEATGGWEQGIQTSEVCQEPAASIFMFSFLGLAFFSAPFGEKWAHLSCVLGVSGPIPSCSSKSPREATQVL